MRSDTGCMSTGGWCRRSASAFGAAVAALAIGGCAFTGSMIERRPAQQAAPPQPSARATRAVEALVQRSGDTLLERHVAETARTLGTPIVAGNAAVLLIDGPRTHERMFAAIAAARDHVNLVSYIISDDETGARLAEALIERRSRGVIVNLMYDSVGSMDTPTAWFDRLREAGVAVCEFNPINPSRTRRGWRVNNRDHRKILVVDGHTGFTGGINVSDVYSSGSFRSGRQPPSKMPWRDTHVMIAGPAVAGLQRSFVDRWIQQGCPDELIASARRGVEVQLLLPSVSDFWPSLEAGRSHYSLLLASGVRIHEREGALLHAKTAVIDGVWSTIGSTNLDFRSFIHNEEANVIVFDDAFALELERLFQRDVALSTEITPERWARRGIVPKLRQWLAQQFEYLL